MHLPFWNSYALCHHAGDAVELFFLQLCSLNGLLIALALALHGRERLRKRLVMHLLLRKIAPHNF